MSTPIILRPQQQQVVDSRARLLGVSSVPGSGKSETIARAGAAILLRQPLQEGQEILLVTFSRSATGNFKRRIRRVLQEAGHIATTGYRVTTLHGLAHMIVRERHEVVGLDRNFRVLDEQLSGYFLNRAVHTWLAQNGTRGIDAYLNRDKPENWLNQKVREEWPASLRHMAGNFIKQAKDLCLPPAAVTSRLRGYGLPLALAEICSEIYTLYQEELRAQAALDYNDLLMEAYRILDLRPDYRVELQQRWPYILEDEAQDSCLLQEKILRLIAGHAGRWIRVGDPNQAIYESFTTANPELLLRFLKEADQAVDLPVSGRSSSDIIALANTLMRWTNTQTINPLLQSAIVPPEIRPTAPGDSQPNPPADPDRIQFLRRPLKDREEINAVLDAAEAWAAAHPRETCAVLVFDNARGQEYIQAMQKRGMPYRELLRNSSETSDVARTLGTALYFLDVPTQPRRLENLFRKWKREEIANASGEDSALYTAASEWLNSLKDVEAFLYPANPEQDPLQLLSGPVRALIEAFAVRVRRWLAEKPLSIDQLMLTISQDMFRNAADLATAYQMARLLAMELEVDGSLTLGALALKLKDIMEQKRALAGLSNDDLNFRPEDYPGEVVIATMHRAKGLEWDQVFLTGLNNYAFPFATGGEFYTGQKAYIRDGLILAEEALGQLGVLTEDVVYGSAYQEGQPTEAARLKIASERLRLLFVGITRAKRGLHFSWNVGRFERSKACEAFNSLADFWEQRNHAKTEENQSLQPVDA